MVSARPHTSKLLSDRPALKQCINRYRRTHQNITNSVIARGKGCKLLRSACLCVCLSVCSLTYLNKSSAVAEMGDRLATRDMSQKVGLGCCAHFPGELGPHQTQCRLGQGLPPSIPSGILMHPTVWALAQYTNVTDRTDRTQDNGPIAYRL